MWYPARYIVYIIRNRYYVRMQEQYHTVLITTKILREKTGVALTSGDKICIESLLTALTYCVLLVHRSRSLSGGHNPTSQTPAPLTYGRLRQPTDAVHIHLEQVVPEHNIYFYSMVQKLRFLAIRLLNSARCGSVVEILMAFSKTEQDSRFQTNQQVLFGGNTSKRKGP